MPPQPSESSRDYFQLRTDTQTEEEEEIGSLFLTVFYPTLERHLLIFMVIDQGFN